MIRLLGIELPKNKMIVYSLTSIYGIGYSTAKKIILKANIDPNTKTNELTVEDSKILRKIIENSELKLEGELKRSIGLNIKELKDINCFRGKRHNNNLPVRGQRTKTNSRTQRISKQVKKLNIKKN